MSLDPSRHKHHGDAESAAAYSEAVRPSLPERRAAVFAAIAAAGEHGITCAELAAQWNVSPNQISGRFTELKAAGRIELAERRKTDLGCTAKAFRVKTAQPLAMACAE